MSTEALLMDLSSEAFTQMNALLAKLPGKVSPANKAILYEALHGALRRGASLAYDDGARIASEWRSSTVRERIAERGDEVLKRTFAQLPTYREKLVSGDW